MNLICVSNILGMDLQDIVTLGRTSVPFQLLFEGCCRLESPSHLHCAFNESV